jgi:hypothetical protein
MLRDLTNFVNDEPWILPPAKKPRFSTRVKGNLNHFECDDPQVCELLFLAATGQIPDHIKGKADPKEKKNYYIWVLGVIR